MDRSLEEIIADRQVQYAFTVLTWTNTQTTWQRRGAQTNRGRGRQMNDRPPNESRKVLGSALEIHCRCCYAVVNFTC